MAQVEIADIQKREKEKYQNEKEKKIEKEISRIQFKHNSEIQAMELKIENQKIFHINAKNLINIIIIKNTLKFHLIRKIKLLIAFRHTS